MKHVLTTSIEGQNPGELFDGVSNWPEFRDAGLPFSVGIGHTEVDPANWRSIRDAQNPTGGVAFWDDFEKQLVSHPKRNTIVCEIQSCFEQASETLDRLLPLPFTLISLGAVFPGAWRHADGCRFWSFAAGHIDHGWGCIFRGAGHDRLVSRRWLDHGPWRVVHLPDDTTFIQFHDLSITDPIAAYEQAKVGHQRMGIDPTGGFIQGIDPDVFAQIRGMYNPETRTLEIVVGPGCDVSQQDMRVSCALRLYHRLNPPTGHHVEHVAYVFVDQGDAERHLHELWLRELRCFVFDERGKRRLDLDYQPTPRPPAWVANLAASPVNDLGHRYDMGKLL